MSDAIHLKQDSAGLDFPRSSWQPTSSFGLRSTTLASSNRPYCCFQRLHASLQAHTQSYIVAVDALISYLFGCLSGFVMWNLPVHQFRRKRLLSVCLFSQHHSQATWHQHRRHAWVDEFFPMCTDCMNLLFVLPDGGRLTFDEFDEICQPTRIPRSRTYTVSLFYVAMVGGRSSATMITYFSGWWEMPGVVA